MRHSHFIMWALLALCMASPASADDVAWSPPLGTDELVAGQFSPIPLQAGVCDIVGVGIVTNTTANSISLNVVNYWVGNPGSNTLTLLVNNALPPVTNTPIVFFATRYSSFSALEPWQCRYTYIFDMDYHRQRFQPDGLFLFDDGMSWFPATSNNFELVAFSSNLVHATQVTINKTAFYDIIRDGARLYPESSRIRRDSETLFDYCSYWAGTNFMKQIWSDQLLTGRIRHSVNNNFWSETGTWLP